MIDTILLDLDGTLLPMDMDRFVKAYVHLLADHFDRCGYNGRHVVRGLWEGMDAMRQNQGARRNAEVFWAAYCRRMGPQGRRDEALFEEFYATDFAKARTVCGDAAQSQALLQWLKDRELDLVLATNPLFPRVATYQRIRWAGLDPRGFRLITTYENAHFCKPSLGYYREILKNLHKKPEQCLMIGNDTTEDLAARELGIPVFLLTDHLLDRAHIDLTDLPHGSYPELQEFLQNIL